MGALVAPRDLQCAMNGYRHAVKEVVREGKEAEGSPGSGVSHIAAQTQPQITESWRGEGCQKEDRKM